MADPIWTKLEGVELITDLGAMLTGIEFAMSERYESSTKMLVKGIYENPWNDEAKPEKFEGFSWLREGRDFDGEMLLSGIPVNEAEDILVAVELHLDEMGNEVFEKEFARIFGEEV